MGMIVDIDHYEEILYAIDADGNLKSYNIPYKQINEDWGNVSEFGANYLAAAYEKLFIVNCAGEVLAFNTKTQKLLHASTFSKDVMTMTIKNNPYHYFTS